MYSQGKNTPTRKRQMTNLTFSAEQIAAAGQKEILTALDMKASEAVKLIKSMNIEAATTTAQIRILYTLLQQADQAPAPVEQPTEEITETTPETHLDTQVEIVVDAESIINPPTPASLDDVLKQGLLKIASAAVQPKAPKAKSVKAAKAPKEQKPHEFVVREVNTAKAPKTQKEWKDIEPDATVKPVKAGTVMAKIVELLEKGSTIEEFESYGIGTGRNGLSHFAPYIKKQKGYGVKYDAVTGIYSVWMPVAVQVRELVGAGK